MLNKAMMLIIAAAALATTASGQSYRGTWTMTSGKTKLTLVLNQGSGGQVTGTLSSSTGAVFQLNGRVQEGVVMGSCQGQAGSSQFEASFEGSLLILTLIETSAAGETTSRSLEFVPAAGGGTSDALGLPPAQTGAPPRKAVAPGAKPASPQPTAPSVAAPQAPRSGVSPVSVPEMGISFTRRIVFDSSKPDGTPRKLLDVSKLTALGWQPRIPLAEGVAQTYRWYLETQRQDIQPTDIGESEPRDVEITVPRKSVGTDA